MSLSVDGVWKAGVWATTVWADGVWREGDAPPPTPSPSPAPTPSGGWTHMYDREMARRRRRKDELDAARKAVEAIPEEASREIGVFLQKQEREDESRATLERLREMLPRFQKQDLSGRAGEALERARVRGTLAALSQLDRELKRMLEDEEMTVLMILLQDD